MSTQPTIRLAAAEPVKDVIDVLEDALALARSGDLRSVAICGDLTGNNCYRAAAVIDGVTLLGHVARMMFSINRAMTGGDE